MARTGFALLELVVSLLILSLLGVFLLQAAHISDDRESLSAERLAQDLRYVQTWAMMSHNKTWVAFDTSNDRYTLYVEDPANPGKAGRLTMTDPLTLTTFQVTLGDDETAGVVLAGPSFGGKSEVEFDRNGLAYDGDDTALASVGTVRVGARTVSVSPAGWVGVS